MQTHTCKYKRDAKQSTSSMQNILCTNTMQTIKNGSTNSMQSMCRTRCRIMFTHKHVAKNTSMYKLDANSRTKSMQIYDTVSSGRNEYKSYILLRERSIHDFSRPVLSMTSNSSQSSSVGSTRSNATLMSSQSSKKAYRQAVLKLLSRFVFTLVSPVGPLSSKTSTQSPSTTTATGPPTYIQAHI